MEPQQLSLHLPASDRAADLRQKGKGEVKRSSSYLGRLVKKTQASSKLGSLREILSGKKPARSKTARLVDVDPDDPFVQASEKVPKQFPESPVSQRLVSRESKDRVNGQLEGLKKARQKVRRELRKVPSHATREGSNFVFASRDYFAKVFRSVDKETACRPSKTASVSRVEGTAAFGRALGFTERIPKTVYLNEISPRTQQQLLFRVPLAVSDGKGEALSGDLEGQEKKANKRGEPLPGRSRASSLGELSGEDVINMSVQNRVRGKSFDEILPISARCPLNPLNALAHLKKAYQGTTEHSRTRKTSSYRQEYFTASLIQAILGESDGTLKNFLMGGVIYLFDLDRNLPTSNRLIVVSDFGSVRLQLPIYTALAKETLYTSPLKGKEISWLKKWIRSVSSRLEDIEELCKRAKDPTKDSLTMLRIPGFHSDSVRRALRERVKKIEQWVSLQSSKSRSSATLDSLFRFIFPYVTDFACLAMVCYGAFKAFLLAYGEGKFPQMDEKAFDALWRYGVGNVGSCDVLGLLDEALELGIDPLQFLSNGEDYRGPVEKAVVEIWDKLKVCHDEGFFEYSESHCPKGADLLGFFNDVRRFLHSKEDFGFTQACYEFLNHRSFSGKGHVMGKEKLCELYTDYQKVYRRGLVRGAPESDLEYFPPFEEIDQALLTTIHYYSEEEPVSFAVAHEENPLLKGFSLEECERVFTDYRLGGIQGSALIEKYFSSWVYGAILLHHHAIYDFHIKTSSSYFQSLNTLYHKKRGEDLPSMIKKSTLMPYKAMCYQNACIDYKCASQPSQALVFIMQKYCDAFGVHYIDKDSLPKLLSSDMRDTLYHTVAACLMREGYFLHFGAIGEGESDVPRMTCRLFYVGEGGELCKRSPNLTIVDKQGKPFVQVGGDRPDLPFVKFVTVLKTHFSGTRPISFNEEWAELACFFAMNYVDQFVECKFIEEGVSFLDFDQIEGTEEDLLEICDFMVFSEGFAVYRKRVGNVEEENKKLPVQYFLHTHQMDPHHSKRMRFQEETSEFCFDLQGFTIADLNTWARETYQRQQFSYRGCIVRFNEEDESEFVAIKGEKQSKWKMNFEDYTFLRLDTEDAEPIYTRQFQNFLDEW